jgi:UDP-glucose 4-epimerase
MGHIYVVTGGAGFIGSHLAQRLLKDGHRVHVVDNLATGKSAHLELLQQAGDFHFHRVNILETDQLKTIFQGADVVFHQAALASVQGSIDDPRLYHDYNATGSLSVLMAARDAGVRRVVYASTSAAYGDSPTEFKSETERIQPLSPYGVAKCVGESYCQVFQQVYGLETVALRYFNVFGPRQDPQSQYAAVIPLFITRMLRGEAPTIYGDGSQSRDFIYIDNVVQGNLLAAHTPAANGAVINLATGERTTLLELIAHLNSILGTHLTPIHAAERTGDIKHSCATIEKARSLLGYSPAVDFRTALARTVEWYQGRENA